MAIGRRSALLGAPLLLSGCGLFSDDPKEKLAGKREPIIPGQTAGPLQAETQAEVELPAPAALADWPQSGGNAAHAVGNVAVSGLAPSWRTSIGSGNGYRVKLTAQPVVAGGTVYAMDSNGQVSAIDLASGSRKWRTDTQAENDRSSNLGGGIAVDGGVVCATTGRAEALGLNAATGEVLWRKDLGVPARSGPALANGRMYFTTLGNRLVALASKTGDRVWEYGGTDTQTTVLSVSPPAVSDGFVVAGFASGELAAVREDGGSVAWSDALTSAAGLSTVSDLAAIRAMPVIDGGRVFAIGVGGLLVSLDLRTGRRLWQREFGGGQAPCLAGNWLFVQSSTQSLIAMTADTGRVRWRQDLPRWGNIDKQRDPIFWSGPLLASGRLVLASDAGQAVSVSPKTGALLGSQALDEGVTLAPLAASRTMLMLLNSGSIQAFT